jgi:hypothetical protein
MAARCGGGRGCAGVRPGRYVISAGVGWAVAVTLQPDEPPPAPTEQTTPVNQQRTSPAEGRSLETTTERSASPTATATASPSP